MSWEPFTRDELSALIDDGLAHADDSVIRAWNAMRIEPVKWQCSPWGDQGGGFWAVAVRGNVVVWYNDIEHGFNASSFDRHGTISEYVCNQGDFHDFLRTMPEANAAERRTPPGVADVPTPLAGPGHIVRRQTTYWTVQSANGSRWRIHFRGKLETCFARAEFPSVRLLDSHPLLSHHTEPWADLYFRGQPADSDRVEAAITEAVLRSTDGWRTAAEYRNPDASLQGGYGLLMRAPSGVLAEVEPALAQASVRTSRIPSHVPTHKCSVLLLGDSYAIAEQFRFERLKEREQ